MNLTIGKNVINMQSVIYDIETVLATFASTAGINIEKYTTAVNGVIGGAQSDLQILHGMGWAGLAMVILRVCMSNMTLKPITDVPVTPSVAPPAK